LSQFFEEKKVRIDLYEFEERFVQAHLPLEQTILILCKSCHLLYDNKLRQDEKLSELTSIKEESTIISLLTQQQMNKSKALDICRQNGFNNFSYSNTIFSNIIV